MKLLNNVIEKLKGFSVKTKSSKIKTNKEFMFFEGEEITNDTIEKLNIKTLEFCTQEGNRGIEELVQIGRNINSKCTTIFGWILLVIISMIGSAFMQLFNGKIDILLYMTLYGLMALGIVAFRIFKGALYSNSVYLSGNIPSQPIREEVLKQLEGITNEDLIYKYIVGWNLSYIQERFNDCMKENERRHEVYKSSIKLLAFFILTAFLLFVCYWLYL